VPVLRKPCDPGEVAGALETADAPGEGGG
jgi:hypothetical protein